MAVFTKKNLSPKINKFYILRPFVFKFLLSMKFVASFNRYRNKRIIDDKPTLDDWFYSFLTVTERQPFDCTTIVFMFPHIIKLH